MKQQPPDLPIPPSLDSENFRDAWAEWVEFRMSLKKVKRWDLLFSKQLQWLENRPIPQAIAILDQSIRNGWQGLFELPNAPRAIQGSNQGIPAQPSRFTLMKEHEFVLNQLKEIRNRATEMPLDTIYAPGDAEKRRELIKRKKQIEEALAKV